MTILDPTAKPESSFADSSSFVIEEGSLGPHLPRPSKELLTSGGGAILMLVGFYLPWVTFQQIGQNPQGNQSLVTLSGWTMATAGFATHQSDTLSVYATLLLYGLPALAAAVAFGMQVRWLRTRMTPFTCGLAVAALAVGLLALFAESFSIYFYTFISSVGSTLAVRIGIGLVLVLFGYLVLVAGILASCLGCWRGFRQSGEQV